MRTPISSPQSNSAGIQFFRTDEARIDWSVRQDTQFRIKRFERLQNAAASDATVSLGLLAARLVALDAIPPAALKLLDSQESRPYRTHEGCAVEWFETNPARVERRFINPFTLLAWPLEDSCDQSTLQSQCTIQSLASTKGLRRSLAKWLELSNLYEQVEHPLDELARDQLCWLHEYSPAALFGHLAGVSVMAAVPRSCLARLEGRKALQQDESQVEPGEMGATISLVQATLEAAGDSFSEGLIRMAADVFKHEHPSGIDGYTKRRWAESLSELASRVRRAHPAVGVVIGWAAHQAEFGTVDSSNPAARTVKRYSLRLMQPIAVGLRDFPVEISAWKPAQLFELYNDIIKNTVASARSETSAAISSFHAYLEEWHDVAPLEKGIGQWTPSKPPVRANLLWEHELDRCIELAAECEDERLGSIAVCCLWIARENPVRIQDLLRLRLVNVHFPDDGSTLPLEIEVVRDAGRGRLKTVDSQRRLFIRDQAAIACLARWHSRRTSEAAPQKALLFGDRNDDRRVYRQAALHHHLNQLVKKVTGDPEVRFHHLRHTVVSQRLHNLLLTTSLVDANQLEVLAADCGHSSPRTSLQVYSHAYEQPLRMWLDLGLTSSLKFTGEEAQAVTGIKANTLVQTARRRGVSMTAVVLDRMEQLSKRLPVEACCSIYTFADPKAPQVSGGHAYQVTPTVVADVLARLMDGQPVSMVAPLLNLQKDAFLSWHESLITWIQGCVQRQYPRKHHSSVSTDLRTLLSTLKADFARMFSERLPGLREYLMTSADRVLMEQAVASWMSCARGDHIALDADTRPRGLFQFLRASGVPPTSIRLVIQRETIDPTDELERQRAQAALNSGAAFKDANVSKAVDIFHQEFGLHPRLELREARVDRPRIYLQLTSKPSESVTPSAASALGILKAWLVVLQAHLLLPAAEGR